MHPALHTPEVFMAVLHALERTDQARMGMTCHYAWSLAMRLVWKEIPKLACILRLFDRPLTKSVRNVSNR